jgi:hypothetical protein
MTQALRKTAGPLVRERTEVGHGMFRIVAGQQGEVSRAVAYLGMKPLHSVEGESVDAAVETIKFELDGRTGRLKQERVDGVPTQKEYLEALLGARISQRTANLLKAHSRFPERTASIDDIARRCAIDVTTVTSDYLRTGRQLGALLSFAPRVDGCPKRLLPILSIATSDDWAGEPELQLRAELSAALDRWPHDRNGLSF